MIQEPVPSMFRLAAPGEREVVSSKPGRPIVVVEGPADFQPYVVQMSEWKGNLRVSIRQHYAPKANSKVLLPSKRGLDLVPALASAIAEAIQWVLSEQENSDPSLEVAAVRDLGAVATEIEEESPF